MNVGVFILLVWLDFNTFISAKQLKSTSSQGNKLAEKTNKQNLLLSKLHHQEYSNDSFVKGLCPLQQIACSSLSDFVSCFRCIYPKITEWNDIHGSLQSVDVNFCAYDEIFEFTLRRTEEPPVLRNRPHISIVNEHGSHKGQFNNLQLFDGLLSNGTGTVSGIYSNGIFDGIIRTMRHTYYIEPLYHFFVKLANYSQQMVFYRDIDLNKTTLSLLHRDGLSGSRMWTNGTNMSSEILQSAKQRLKQSIRERRATHGIKSSLCNLHLVSDHLFYGSAGNYSVEATLSEMIFHLTQADAIFRSTDFDGDGLPDNIGFVVVNVTIYTNTLSPGYKLAINKPDASSILDIFSTYNFDSVCLAFLFTSRTFSGGTVGLSWTAGSTPHSAPGGICQKLYSVDGTADFTPGWHSFNTGLVTNQNFGSILNRNVISLTLTHEFGHSFGSMHDDPNDPVCAPTKGGKYIMYAYASQADEPNNFFFSQCSIPYMEPVIHNKGSCLIVSHGPVCGNMLVEPPEECDCGLSTDCDVVDKCCTAARFPGDPDGCVIRRSVNYACSPKFSPCCDHTCQIVMANTTQCLVGTECLHSSYCDGQFATCPLPHPRPDGVLCRGGAGVCREGSCSLSMCSQYGLAECQCTLPDYRCHLCCRCPGKQAGPCVPAFIVNITSSVGTVIMRQPGETCNNHRGYCDDKQVCVATHGNSSQWSDQTKSIRVLTPDMPAPSPSSWLLVNWYVLVFGLYALLLTVTLARISWRHWWPISKTGESARRYTEDQWGEGEEVVQALQQQHDHLVRMHQAILTDLETPTTSVKDASIVLCRLATFFPTAPRDVLQNTLGENASEEEAVKQLVTHDYSIRQLADSHTLSGKVATRMPRRKHHKSSRR